MTAKKLFDANKKFILKHYDAVLRILLGLFFIRFFIFAISIKEALIVVQAPSWLFKRLFSGPSPDFFLYGALGFGLLFSIFLTAGFLIRISSIVVALSLIVVLNHSVVIWQFHYTYLTVILFCYALFCSQDFFSRKISLKNHFYVDTKWKDVIAIVFGMAMTTSGLSKLVSTPHWRNGTALVELCNYRKIEWFGFPLDCVSLSSVLTLGTWIGLVLELSCVFLVAFKVTRLFFLLVVVALQVGIMMTMDIPYLNTGMLLAHLALFKREWLQPFFPVNPKNIKPY